ncbi:MAG TPA: four helix bundle protein [Blastocatellia bacterium]|nr:four helix bundle protein [Blastocatellia bacterium]
MKYRRFEDLPVWKDAIELAVRTFALTANPCFRGHAGTRNQLENAVVSISNNIAEGFERGTTNELLNFLYISRGSAGETRSMYCLIERLPEFHDLRSEISDLKSKAESISRQLRAWADSLQNTDIRGTRYLTDQSRRIDKQRQEREEFLAELEQIRNRKK